MVPEKLKETGWQAQATGLVIAVTTAVVQLFGQEHLGFDKETIPEIWEMAAIYGPLIVGGQGYRAIRMRQKSKDGAAANAAPPAANAEDEEEGPWD